MIDEKGKLFGKLNIIDLIAIILIVAVVALLGYKLTSSSGGFTENGQQVRFTVKVEGVDAQVYENIQDLIPGQLMTGSQMLNGKIVAVEGTQVEEDSIHYRKDAGSNQLTTYRSDAGSYDLVFTIEATLENVANNALGTQEVRVGRSYTVKTNSFELANGLILSCEYLEAE